MNGCAAAKLARPMAKELPPLILMRDSSGGLLGRVPSTHREIKAFKKKGRMWYAGRMFEYVGHQNNTSVWREIEAVCGCGE